MIEQDEEGAHVVVSDRWFCHSYGGLPGNTRELGNHMDGTTRLPGSKSGRSCTTLLIYLNDDFEGGTTTFMSGHDGVAVHSIVPGPGKAVLLRQDTWHSGDLVTSGVKYLLRTDVGDR
jgi:hypothetical protein